jgi:hypothetical protein
MAAGSQSTWQEDVRSMEGLGAIVPEQRVGVLNARLSPKDGTSGSRPLHLGVLQQTDRGNVARVSDADDPDRRRVLKQETHRLAQRLGSKAPPLEGRGNGEAKFGGCTVGCYTESNVSDETR